MRRCVYCGRRETETVLNIEGHLHHMEPYRCIDTKSCQRITRRMKRRTKNGHRIDKAEVHTQRRSPEAS
jgi:hypothetical protein